MEKKKSTPKSSLKKTKSVSKSAKKSAAKEKAPSPRKGEVKRGVVSDNRQDLRSTFTTSSKISSRKNSIGSTSMVPS